MILLASSAKQPFGFSFKMRLMRANNTSSSSEPGLSRKAVSPFSARTPSGRTSWRRRHRRGSCSDARLHRSLHRASRTAWRCSPNNLSVSHLSRRTPECRPPRRRPLRDPASNRYCRRPSGCRRRCFSVSISTAVWIVMCSEPAMRAPFSGCFGPNSSRVARTGHFGLGERDFLAAEFGEPDVLHDVVGGGLGGGFRCCVHDVS